MSIDTNNKYSSNAHLVTIHSEGIRLAAADCAATETKGRDVGVPAASRRVEERVSAEVAAAAGWGGRATGGAALALHNDWVRAVGGRADHRLAFHFAPATAKQKVLQ